MQRLTQGQPNYFRKRIRMAVYQGAAVRDVDAAAIAAAGRGREISVSPYVDDPNRAAL